MGRDGYKDTQRDPDTGRRTEIRDANYEIRGNVEVSGNLTQGGEAVGGIPTSALDTDPTLAADSDSKVASQKATKAYVDANAGGGGVTNSAPENTVPKSDAGGDLVASNITDSGSTVNINAPTGLVSIGDAVDQTGSVINVVGNGGDIDLRTLTGRVLAGDINSEGNDTLLAVDDTQQQINLRAPLGIVNIGDPTGLQNETNLRVDDDAQTISLDAQNGVLINGVKRYVALLTQTGTDDPVATVLENSLGGTVVWGRSEAGIYTGNLTGAFTLNKTTVTFGNVPVPPVFVATDTLSVNALSIITKFASDTFTGQFDNFDGLLSGVKVEILVYPE